MYTVIDNFYEQEQFDKLQRMLLGPRMPWFYMPQISVPPWITVNDPNAVETDGLHNVIVDRERNYISQEYRVLYPYLVKMMAILGYTEENLYRVRAAMKWPKPGFGSDMYNIPHIDATWPNKTIVFYLNDSDGDTRLFHQRQQKMDVTMEQLPSDVSEEQLILYGNQFIKEGFTVMETVTPKANRLLIFDGMMYHTAGIPVNTERRVILNINIRE
jgi:hypothetical protein